jgi:hypothetical protein
VDRAKAQRLPRKLEDGRGKRVVFLSHCILNENTRYPGGACRGGCVREIVEQCLAAKVGMVQMPCPEQLVWGGVNRRLLIATFGTEGTLPKLGWLERSPLRPDERRLPGAVLPIFSPASAAKSLRQPDAPALVAHSVLFAIWHL